MTNRYVPPAGCVNFPELLARVENDRGLLGELFSVFKADFPHSLQRLQAAVAKGNAPLVMSVSHTLKGMLANLAADKASAAAARLEQIARSGDTSAIGPAFSDFQKVAAGLLPEIEGYLTEARA